VEVFVKGIDKLTGLGERLRRRAGAGAGADEVVAAGVSAAAAGGPGTAAATPGLPAAAGGADGASSAPGAADVSIVDVSLAGSTGSADAAGVDPRDEAALWERLRSDPNDVEAFPRLAEIVRFHAAEGHAEHAEGDRQRAADDAVWALAEELAHNARAWYPLIEMARLSVHDDRDAALRRLATAAERDPSGRALATGLAVLRDEHLPNDALGLGVAHWRPREHDLEAGRHLVLAAIEARRIGDARRHLDALSSHPDAGRVAELRRELEGLITQLEAERASGGPMTDPAGISVTGPLSAPIDLRGINLPR
jgi:hypothetical protein